MTVSLNSKIQDGPNTHEIDFLAWNNIRKTINSTLAFSLHYSFLQESLSNPFLPLVLPWIKQKEHILLPQSVHPDGRPLGDISISRQAKMTWRIVLWPDKGGYLLRMVKSNHELVDQSPHLTFQTRNNWYAQTLLYIITHVYHMGRIWISIKVTSPPMWGKIQGTQNQLLPAWAFFQVSQFFH